MESLSRETENFATHFMMDCYSSSQEDVKFVHLVLPSYSLIII